MEEEKKLKCNKGGIGITAYLPEYDEQVFNYWRTVSNCQGQPMRLFGNECLPVCKNLSEPKKVVNTVGTFLNGDSNGFQISATKVASEKVTNMVGTF